MKCIHAGKPEVVNVLTSSDFSKSLLLGMLQVHLLLYREAEKTKDHEQEDVPVAEYIVEYVAPSLGLLGDHWGADIPYAQ